MIFLTLGPLRQICSKVEINTLPGTWNVLVGGSGTGTRFTICSKLWYVGVGFYELFDQKVLLPSNKNLTKHSNIFCIIHVKHISKGVKFFAFSPTCTIGFFSLKENAQEISRNTFGFIGIAKFIILGQSCTMFWNVHPNT